MTEARVYERPGAERVVVADGRGRDLTSQLNPEQAAAATFGEGPLLIRDGSITRPEELDNCVDGLEQCVRERARVYHEKYELLHALEVRHHLRAARLSPPDARR